MSTLATELAAWRSNYALPLQSGDCVDINTFVGLYRTMNKINDLINKYLSTTEWGTWDNMYASDERLYINDCWVEPNDICSNKPEVFAYLSNPGGEHAYDFDLKRNFVGIMDRAWAAAAYMADKTKIVNDTTIDEYFDTIFGGYVSPTQPCRNGNQYYERTYYEGLVRDLLANPPAPLTEITDIYFDKFLEQKRDKAADCSNLTVSSTLFSDWLADQDCPFFDLINTAWAMVEALRRDLAFCWIHSNGNDVNGLGDDFSDPDQATESDFTNGPRMTSGRVEKVGTFTPTSIDICYSGCGPDDPTTMAEACADSKTENEDTASTLISSGSYWLLPGEFSPRPQPEQSVYVRPDSHNTARDNYNDIEHEPRWIKTLYSVNVHWADSEVTAYKSFVIPSRLDEAFEWLDEEDEPVYPSDYGHFSDRYTEFFNSGYVTADLNKIKNVYTETTLYYKTMPDGTEQRRLKFGGTDDFFNELNTPSDYTDLIDEIPCTAFGRYGFKLVVGLIAEMCVSVPTSALTGTCTPSDDPVPPDEEIPIPEPPGDSEDTGDLSDLT